jgi:hypothetical protein
LDIAAGEYGLQTERTISRLVAQMSGGCTVT